MATNADLIRGVYKAFGEGDLPAVLAILDPQVEWTEAEGIPYAGTYRGPDAVVAGVFGPLLADWDGFRVAPDEFVDGGDTIVALGRYSGTYKETGKAMSCAFAHVWTLRGGKVVRFRQHVDSALFRAAMQS